jgi:CheY-like chemotaxis protein
MRENHAKRQIMKNNNRNHETNQLTKQADLDLTEVFNDAQVVQTVTSSAAFEATYGLLTMAKEDPRRYEIVWGVQLAVNGTIRTRPLRTRQGRARLLELPILQRRPSDGDACIAIHITDPTHWHLMLAAEYRETPIHRVLFAEYDADIGQALKSRLSGRGFEVTVKRNAAATLEAVRNEDFDLVLLDVDLPDMHGFALCSKIRENPVTRHLPIVICSAWPNVGDLAAKAGAVCYLEKPLDFGGLLERLSELLQLPDATAPTHPSTRPPGDQTKP